MRSKLMALTMTIVGVSGPAFAFQPTPPTAETFAAEQGSGAYASMFEEDAGLPNHVVYRPKDLSAVSKLGVYIFGNGGCSDHGISSAPHLLEIASHGYVAVAPGGIEASPPRPPAEGQQFPPVATTSDDPLDALNYVLAQNKDKDSPYYGKIDEDAVAVSGFSCGGLQALQISADERIKTTVVMNSGLFADTAEPLPGLTATKDLLNGISHPILYVLGGETDIAYGNGMDDYERLSKRDLPVAVANLPVGHGGTYLDVHGGRAAALVVNWLEWVLRGNADAGANFLGSECGYCTSDEWTFQSSDLDLVAAE